MEVWTTQKPLPTSSTGTTDITHLTITTTPVAALHVVSNGISNSIPAPQGKLGIGASDGTNDRAVGFNIQDAQATTNVNELSVENGCVVLPFAGSSGEDGKVSHNSFIAGGQRVNNDNGFSAAYRCNSLFFSCDNASLLTATLSASVDVAVNVDPGFAWKCVIIFGIPRASPSAGAEAEVFIGFYDKTNQGGLMFNSQDAQAAADPSLQISTTYVGGEMALGTGALDYGILASVGSGTSLDLTPKNAGGDGDEVYCLFLGWSGSEGVLVKSWDSPASTGSNAYTGVGFQPQGMLNLHTFAAAYDTAEQDADGGALGISMWTADDQHCVSIQDEQGAATTNTGSIVDNTAIEVRLDVGSTGDTASLTSMDSDGWTLNYTAVEGTVNKQLSLIFGVSTGNTGQLLRRGSMR